MGFLNIDKPLNYTSHDVVAKVRRRYRDLTGTKKVGHAGTLDPLATGVLILCLGGATRLSDYVMHGTKQYHAHITLGTVTDTYDAEGDIIETHDASHITRADIDAVLPQFIGDIQQIPPMYSAIKVDGKKLYDLAREGKSIERKARHITIDSLTVASWDSPTLTIDVTCSAGTYVRSLAYNIGQALGVGAYLSGLTRTASGTFHIDNAINLDTIMTDDTWHQHIVAPFTALQQHPSITVTPEQITHLQHGQFILRHPEMTDETVFAFTSERDLVAILTPRGNHWKPHKVFLHSS
jgi:tRNA pseudouridine55 synthase